MKKINIILLTGSLLVVLYFFVKKQYFNKEEYTIRSTIVCSTSIIEDTIKNLIGNYADIISIMGPGIDPHLYKASSADAYNINKADIIFYNGLHLEGKMGDIFKSIKNNGRAIYSAGDAIPDYLLLNTEYEDIYDPHIWHDVSLWKLVVDYFSSVLETHYPEHKEIIEQNKNTYIEKLDELDFLVKEKISEIKYSKILVTSHDAFSYFSKRYGIDNFSVQGISTDAEPTIQDTEKILKVLTENTIPTIFVEQTVCPNYLKNIQSIMKQQGKQVKIGPQLYSDALGQTGGKTYITMITDNVIAITEGLNNYEP